jgi:hypothetical protein
MIGKIISKTIADVITIPLRLPKDVIEAAEKAVDPDEEEKERELQRLRERSPRLEGGD